MINHCDLCKKVIWGKAWVVKLYDRENRRTLCPECCEMLDMFGRIEEREELGKREEGLGIRARPEAAELLYLLPSPSYLLPERSRRE